MGGVGLVGDTVGDPDMVVPSSLGGGGGVGSGRVCGDEVIAVDVEDLDPGGLCVHTAWGGVGLV